jgi:hypothetical protein
MYEQFNKVTIFTRWTFISNILTTYKFLTIIVNTLYLYLFIFKSMYIVVFVILCHRFENLCSFRELCDRHVKNWTLSMITYNAFQIEIMIVRKCLIDRLWRLSQYFVTIYDYTLLYFGNNFRMVMTNHTVHNMLNGCQVYICLWRMSKNVFKPKFYD